MKRTRLPPEQPVQLPLAALAVPANVLPVASASQLTGAAGALTTRVTVAVLVIEPLVPVMVRVLLPVAALVVVMVSVEEPAPEMLVGLNEALAPVGRPLTPRATVPVKPLTAVVVTV
jgi:hypothetical protein